MDHQAFGGLSAIELGPDGLTFTALSDRGTMVTGRLTRDMKGAVTGAEAALTPMLTPDGTPVGGSASDAEGLAIHPDGRLFVSFEADHRVWTYAAPEANAMELPRAAAFGRLQRNSGLEALAVDADGLLYAIPERSGAFDRPFPVYRWTGTEWDEPFTLPRDGAFLPVGADFGPNGRLYLLERDFRGLFGFRTRVSRFVIGFEGPGAREIVIETRSALHDNLEGIAVWQDALNHTRLTLISDDNFSPLQRTEFVEYRLVD